MLVEVHPDSEQPWAVLFANEAWEQSVGVTWPRDGARVPFWDLFQVGWEASCWMCCCTTRCAAVQHGKIIHSTGCPSVQS